MCSVGLGRVLRFVDAAWLARPFNAASRGGFQLLAGPGILGSLVSAILSRLERGSSLLSPPRQSSTME
jgi:hypothetical protein